jgi:hypothetical protein
MDAQALGRPPGAGGEFAPPPHGDAALATPLYLG